jgi:hypothetical protein
MTTSAPIPAAEVASRMANPSDTASDASTEQAEARAGAVTVVRPSLRAQVAENPLLSFFGLLIVALLAAAIASPHIRIDDTNERIDRLEARVMEFERRVDARFDKLEAAVAEIDRKLTALIAHLNATAAVDDALAGRLTGPGAAHATGTSDDELG